MTEQALKAVEAALTEKRLAELMTDAARWQWLRQQCGNLGDGSARSVSLDPDDALQTWFIHIGNGTVLSPEKTIESIIDAEIKKQPKPDDHRPFITTTQGMIGWFAVNYWWNDRDVPGTGFWEPWDTGFGRYATEAEAIVEAQQWAETEGIEYKPRKKAYGDNCLRSAAE